MLNQNEILLATTDNALAKELIKAKIEGVEIGTYSTRAFGVDEVARFIIEFLSDAGLVYFGHWLGSRHAKIGANKTTINEHEIPKTVEEISALIKKELQKIDKDQTHKNT